MDLSNPHVESRFTPTQAASSDAAWPLPAAQPVLPIYSVESRLRRRRLRVVLGRAVLFGIDGVMIALAFYAAYYIRYIVLHGVNLTTVFINQPFSNFETLGALATVTLLVVFAVKGLYRQRTAGAWFRQFWIITSATTITFAVFSAYEYIFERTDIFVRDSRSLVTLSWVTVIVLVGLTRLLISSGLSALYRRGAFLTPLLVVGSNRLGKLTMQQIAATPSLGYRVVGYIHHDQEGEPQDFGRFSVLGGLSDLDAVIRSQRIEQVIITLPSSEYDLIMSTVNICERAGADFRLAPDLYEMSMARIDVDAIEGIPLIGLRRNLTHSAQFAIKRALDIAGALFVLIAGLPVWLLIALAIKLDSPGPVLHRQTRLGYRGHAFPCFKFRSMYVNADKMRSRLEVVTDGDQRGKFKLKDDPRRTRVGRFIRGASLDEIPQLLNVLRGEMSLIGPRPPLPVEFEKYEDWEKARLDMPPGITGLWQVRGRSDIDFDEMVLMDLYYIENWSLRLDIQIALQTIPAVLSRRGAY
ncbi:MAG TPA: sugar transferase [Ktedonobacterales bacterium]|jgi:exopolysaccharide biosynthesis polyprenyl glycosylphosphotransferase